MSRIERVAAVLAAADADARALGLSDGFMPMAQALEDARLLVPALSSVRITETPTGKWRLRYRVNGKRSSWAPFATREEAERYIPELRARYGVTS
jgi:hypothetical protein